MFDHRLPLGRQFHYENLYHCQLSRVVKVKHPETFFPETL